MSYSATIKRSGNTSADTEFIKQLAYTMPTLEIGLEWDSDNSNEYGSYTEEDYCIDMGAYVINCRLDILVFSRCTVPATYTHPSEYDVDAPDTGVSNIELFINDEEIPLTVQEIKAIRQLIIRNINLY